MRKPLHLPVRGVAICGLVCFAICGAAYMFTVYWPLRSSPWKVTVTISTLGASIALKEIVRLIWGSVPLTMDPIVDGVTHIGSAYFNNQYILILVIGGGLMLGAIFMATDYATSPVTKLGQAIFGVGCGLITCFIRRFGSYPEGVCYSILIMNCTTWLLDKYIRPTIYGAPKKEKKEAAAK